MCVNGRRSGAPFVRQSRSMASPGDAKPKPAEQNSSCFIWLYYCGLIRISVCVNIPDTRSATRAGERQPSPRAVVRVTPTPVQTTWPGRVRIARLRLWSGSMVRRPPAGFEISLWPARRATRNDSTAITLARAIVGTVSCARPREGGTASVYCISDLIHQIISY